jgi:2-dehydropantoate 2-reductase
MRHTVAVLGPGAVGGVLSVRLLLAGHHTITVAPPETVGMVALAGFTVEVDGEVLAARPEVRERLERPVKLLLVTVKAQHLEDALERVDPEAVSHGVVLPLLNGLEHLEPLRAHFGPRVAAGSISHFEAYRVGRVQIVQPTTTRAVISMASQELPGPDLEDAASILQSAGFEVRMEESEKHVLWRKAARLAVLSAATSLTRRSVGALREDPAWRPRLEAAIAEACAVAAADGVNLIPSSQWTVIASLEHDFTTSTARDVMAGRPSELDAVAGSVVRAGERLGVPCPVLSELVSEASMV